MVKKLKMIQELMDKLVSEMEPTKEDIYERIGKKPKIEAIAIEAKSPEMEDMEEMDYKMKDMGEMEDEMEMPEDEMDFSSIMKMGKEDMEDEEEMSDLKKRMMKYKGM